LRNLQETIAHHESAKQTRLERLAGPVLEVKRRDDRWLLSKALDSGRQLLLHLIGPHHVALKLTAVGLAAAIALAIFAKGDYRVSARAVLEAGVRQAIVAPFNGYIKDANVRAGDLVRRGQILCTLEDRELRLERLKGMAQQEQLVKQQNQALAARNAAQVNIAAAQIDQVRAQLALLDEQLARTRVVATFDGIVVTGDLSQALGSPVERGQVLYEISPLSAYRLVLQVDEREIGDVEVGQRGLLAVAAAPSAQLGLTIEKITPVSTAREGRNYFRVEAKLDRIPDYLRPGLEGVGKIEIDRRSLVWIWTRPVVDWVRLTLWTWLP
jgi:RND family efflux transporter MFP subunit